MTDSDGTVAPGSTRPYVDDIFDEDSALTRVIGKAKLGDAILEAAQKYARSLAGKPLAGFCATRGRRIQDLYGMVVHVIRCNTHYAIDNRR